MTAALTAAIKNFRLLLGENCGAPVGCQLFRTAKHVLAEHGVDVSELDPVSDASIHRSD